MLPRSSHWKRRLTGVGVVAGAVIAACGYSPPRNGPSDGSVEDGRPDGGPCTGATLECVDADTLRTCISSDMPEMISTCKWGCLGTAPTARCGELVPGGNSIPPSDVTSTGLTGTIQLSGTLDANSGAISGTTTRGPGEGIIANIDYQQRGGVAMFRFANLRITGPLNVSGSRPIVLVADQGIIVEGVIDATAGCNGRSGGPGGGSGGNRGSNGEGSGGGEGGNSTGGGGGGGHGASGGSGNGDTGGDGGTTAGSATIPMLIGGAGGGGGVGGDAGVGGGGGGAIQLVSNGMIAITVDGGINAGGCGGRGGQSGNGDAAGGGGGAGGVILLEAPTITIDGKLAVNGGGGGGGRVSNGGNGSPGDDGSLDRSTADGGEGDTDGGDGGAGTTPAGTQGGQSSNVGGGGGGGIGRIRINTKTGTATIGAQSVLSPDFNDTATTCTQGPAVVQ